MHSTLTINRDSGYADRLRAYKVILDGDLIGEISDSESKSFKISPGKHTLYLKIDWGRSKKVVFKSSNKEMISFKCDCNVRGKRLLLLPLYATFLASRYLNLNRID